LSSKKRGKLEEKIKTILCRKRFRIEMDEEIKEDAKTYHELNNLRNNPEFMKLLK
jgi:hypothetical protein